MRLPLAVCPVADFAWSWIVRLVYALNSAWSGRGLFRRSGSRILPGLARTWVIEIAMHFRVAASPACLWRPFIERRWEGCLW